MAKQSPMLTSFNGGELSKFIAGRPDVAKYASGCRKMENFIPMVEGPAFTRAGIRYVAEVKESTDRTWLVRFEFDAEDSYMLEFGEGYIRFFTEHAPVVVSGVAAYNNATAYTRGDLVVSAGINYYCITATTGNAPPNATYWHPLTGNIYEIPSPFTADDLTNTDGTFALQYAQTGDVVYIAAPNRQPRKLSRFGPTEWTLVAVDFDPPPFEALNATTTTIYASAKTGNVTLTASAALFTAGHVGQVIYLGEKDVRDTVLWQAAVASIAISDERRSDGKNYIALTAGTTGNVKPTHTAGAEFDGDPGVQWQFMDPGYGYVEVTAYTDSTHVDARVLSQLPSGTVSSGQATSRWAFQAWNGIDGYPTSVTFFRERLVWARDQTLWFSVTADFENYAYDVSGQITADAGFDRTISSDTNNAIRWMSPDDILLVGTVGDEWACTKATTSDPFGPDNCEIKRQSKYGSSKVMSQRVGGVTMFVQRAGRKIRAMEFRFERDGFQSDNICAFARHATTSGVVDMAYQQEPYSILWLCRSDGTLVACTFDREQDVVAWHRHPLSEGDIECVECIPAPTGRDDLWVIGKFTIDGSTKRYIGFLEAEADDQTEQPDWFYVDFGLTYTGTAPTGVISGLDHLEGKEVWVLYNGAWHPNRTVSGGAITLQYTWTTSKTIQIGLPSRAVLETMDIDSGSVSGTSQAKIKRPHVVNVRVIDTLGLKAGPSEAVLEETSYRTPSMPMDQAPPPFTGDLEVEWPADYDKAMRIVIVKDRPMPGTVAGLLPQLVGSEGR